MNKGKKESFKALVDITKGVAIGSYVSSFVGFVLQSKSESWILFMSGFMFTVLAVILSYLYGRRFTE